MALHGSAASVTFEASHLAHLLILSGAEIQEPVVTHGPFVSLANCDRLTSNTEVGDIAH
jgi:redox-sensitive bicupin YhaK (pirin superfamily)